MAMTGSRFRSLYGQRGYRPQSVLNRSLGDIKLSGSRAEGAGVPFNLFPYLGDRVPQALGEIVVETTEIVARNADAKVPVLTGRLKASQRVRYSRSRQTGAVVSGRIDYKAIDPTANEPKHEYAFFVEVGTSKTRAQPFLLPALIEERQMFNYKCRTLESRL
jgi:HK97 gp10 family phage protein